MRRRESQPDEGPGQDSFLDIVANLVGILIILVMVIGVRAKDAMLEASPLPSPDEEPTAAEIDVTTAKAAAAAVDHDIQRLTGKIKREEFEVAYRCKERDKIQLLLAAAEEQMENRRAELNEEQQKQFDLQRQLLAVREELEGLEQSVKVAEGSIPKTAIIEHLPTPMAKTVFGKELHFRLLGGRLAYVPWEELADELHEEAPKQMWRLKQADSITETLGPIGGFLMKYELKKTHTTTTTRVGTAVQQRIELDQFVLVQVEENLGEPASEALLDGSKFHSILSANDPDSTTITIWTYPDSFNEFRELKQQLFQRGYLTASRPLPENHPIGGSPRGTRSAAQ
ncbi:MAG: hypothetical protein CMJ64_08170 [Planctomycetaceae bacterium]|nr:hypothetical protein [Planctomycetaceae bacterium]